MDFENQVKESPLERAKRLKAEKEGKDAALAESETKKQAEAQAKTERLNSLGSSKQDLENKLNDVDTRIENSRNEAHETRDTMKEGGLDKDEEFKGEYDSTISEVTGNLNELRNERNNIKAELEKINYDIENIGVNEAITEGQNEIQESVGTVKEENEQAISQVENYPGVETGDIEKANEIVVETNKEISDVKKETDKEVSGINGEQKIKEILNDIDIPGTYKLDETKLAQAFEIAKELPELKKALENKVESNLSEEIRLTPMMQGKNPTELIKNYSKIVSKDVIESAIANGLQGMTTYSGKTIENLSGSVIDLKDTIGLSTEDTVRLLNQGLDSLTSKVNKLQEQRAKDLENSATPDWKKENITEEMKSAEAFINQQKQRASEICKILQKN